LLLAELKRSFMLGKVAASIVAVIVLMLLAAYENLDFYLQAGREYWNGVGAVDLLQYQMMFDTFKIVIAIGIASVGTGSFCQDMTSQYLRHILSRTDIYAYSLCKFIANMIVILTVSIVSCYLFSLVIILMGFEIVSENARGGMIGGAYYIEIIKKCPGIYIGMVGMQFGLVIAVFSSIGLLFSAYQCNAFVSIGVAALTFYMAMSLPVLQTGILNFLNITGMVPVLPWGYDTSYALSIAWGILLPLILIAVCCQLFYQKLKRRQKDGEL